MLMNTTSLLLSTFLCFPNRKLHLALDSEASSDIDRSSRK